VTIGFPDYYRGVPTSGNLVQTFTATQAGKSGPLVNVDAFASIFMSVNLATAANFYQVYFQWFSDATGSVTIGQSIYVPTPGQSNTWMVPILSSWVTIAVVNVSGNVVESFPVYAYGSQHVARDVGNEQVGTPLLVFGGSIAAGGNKTLGPAPLATGPATLHVTSTSATSWKTELQYWDTFSKVYATFIQVFGSNADHAFPVRVSMPPAPVRLILENLAAGAETMYGSLVLG
jgi:hypothetical protein